MTPAPVVVGLLIAAGLTAEEREIRRVVGDARRAHAEGRFEEAAALFLTAKRKVEGAGLPDAAPLGFNAAVALIDAGRCARAHQLLLQFAEAVPRAAGQETYQQARERAERCAPEAEIETTPPGAQVEVDQRAVGSTPLRLRLDLGTHEVAIALLGHQPHRASLAVEAGARPALRVVLQVDPPPPPPPLALAPAPTPEPPAPVTAPPPPAEDRGPWGWIGGGVAAAGLAVAIGLRIAMEVKLGESDAALASQRPAAEINDPYTTAQAMQAPAAVALVIGVVAGVGTAVWYFSE
jgi:hypothetical protein